MHRVKSIETQSAPVLLTSKRGGGARRDVLMPRHAAALFGVCLPHIRTGSDGGRSFIDAKRVYATRARMKAAFCSAGANTRSGPLHTKRHCSLERTRSPSLVREFVAPIHAIEER